MTFSHYDIWDNTMVFGGKLITCDERPWYYIPVWMLLTIPIWYIVLYILSIGGMIGNGIKSIKTKRAGLICEWRYIFFFASFFWVPFGALVITNSRIYVGWRHVYFLFPPIVITIVLVLDKWFSHCKRRYNKKLLIGTLILLICCMVNQICWIITNHPFEMVYFNAIGKRFASQYDRDYWNLADKDMLEYILEYDGSEFVLIAPGNRHGIYLLDEKSQQRIKWADMGIADYYIESYRNQIGNDLEIEGYLPLHSIEVDDFTISTIYKKCQNEE